MPPPYTVALQCVEPPPGVVTKCDDTPSPEPYLPLFLLGVLLLAVTVSLVRIVRNR